MFRESGTDSLGSGDQSSAGHADQRPESARADALGHLVESPFGLFVEAKPDRVAHRNPAGLRLRHSSILTA